VNVRSRYDAASFGKVSTTMSDEQARREARPCAFVGVDVAVLTAVDGNLKIILGERMKPPELGHWALPGVFMRPRLDSDMVAAAKRALMEKLGIDTSAELVQLGAWHKPGRDPRGWVISVVYFAVLPISVIAILVDRSRSSGLFSIDREKEGTVLCVDSSGVSADLAFDHGAIIAHLLGDLRQVRNIHALALSAMEERFTLAELQLAYEAFLGRRVNKDSFRRSVLRDRESIVPAGDWETGVDHRPARKYRRGKLTRHG
jgi:8-oxo-dGTP diphosphatase